MYGTVKTGAESQRKNGNGEERRQLIKMEKRGGRVCLDRGKKLLSDKLLLFILPPASEVA